MWLPVPRSPSEKPVVVVVAVGPCWVVVAVVDGVVRHSRRAAARDALWPLDDVVARVFRRVSFLAVLAPGPLRDGP